MTQLTVRATYYGEDVEVDFEADDDFGDILDITLATVRICGVEEPLRNLSQALRKALHNYSQGLEFR